MNRALLGIGSVRHLRLRPGRHAFEYPTFFLILPMRSLRQGGDAGALARNRLAPIAFHDRDHGDGGSDSLAWIEGLLAREGIADADGEIWLHCMPRVLGYAFKPVSFWYCHRRDGSLSAIVVEVNNTFGERHCYLLCGPDVGFGLELRVAKAFHVSPFCAVQGHYRFRFLRAGDRTVARIEHHDDEGPLLITSVCGTLAEATPSRQRAALVRMPLMTIGVVARIHWHALRLWIKRVPWFRKPPPPAHPLTR